jgi:hypothetical protein
MTYFSVTPLKLLGYRPFLKPSQRMFKQAWKDYKNEYRP